MNFVVQLKIGEAASLSENVIPGSALRLVWGASPLLVSWYKFNLKKEQK